MRRTTKAVISGHDSWVKLRVYRQCRGMFLFRHYVQQLTRERPSSFMSDTRNIIVSQVVVGENCFECSSGGVTRARTCLTNVRGWWKTSCCILLALLYRHQHVSSKKKARKKKESYSCGTLSLFQHFFMPLLLFTASFGSWAYMVSEWLCSGNTKVCKRWNVMYGVPAFHFYTMYEIRTLIVLYWW